MLFNIALFSILKDYFSEKKRGFYSMILNIISNSEVHGIIALKRSGIYSDCEIARQDFNNDFFHKNYWGDFNVVLNILTDLSEV